MPGLTTCTSSNSACKALTPTAKPAQVSTTLTQNLKATSDEPGADKISPMARQLSDALQRAKHRDASLNRDQLRAVAQTALTQIHSVRLAAPHTINDAEQPNSDDPEILDRARRATDFKNNQGPNPFKGMSPELLAAITYDDSGAFTLHERRAAWSESYDQREVWGRRVVAEAMLEYSLTRGDTRIYGQMLDYYRTQPAIEQAQMPDNHEKHLLEKITSIIDNPDQWHDVSLYDVLRRWLTAQPQQTLFSIMASDSQMPESTLPEVARPFKTSTQPGDAMAVKIALEKAIAPCLPVKPQAS
ncbi:hypothetical protein NJC38_00690 [Pseudomonas sp. 21LCFQ010]|uniref:hypothetical protein n=1 Tax=Pseudomonas sp. 21LCFQ010 TaxID=2957506 RepID=UPI0020975FDD|nr:hypothetical protein [Pseudomonas sp. 21LCFQ010]MCO8160680.1 hypothetical protein [Pseudomonas sp. 21LCFQ010]